MSLNEQELIYTYQKLLHAFPEDLHIARPIVKMLQHRGDNELARNLAMDIARRMLALGCSTYALAFISICEQLKHPDVDEVESIKTMAELTRGAIPQASHSKQFELIESLTDMESKNFLQQGRLLRVQAGESIVKKGEISRIFYLILEGSMRAHVKTNQGEEITLTHLQEGDFFGEFACIYKLPRTATVTASTEVTLLAFEDRVITALLNISPEAGESLIAIVQRRMITSVSHSHPIFTHIEDADRAWLAEQALLTTFQKGQHLLEEDDSDYFYIIAFGKAIASREVDGNILTCTLGVHTLLSHEHRLLRLPKGTTLIAEERCLVCKIPLVVFETFSKAYSGFEQWAIKHAALRNQKLGAE